MLPIVAKPRLLSYGSSAGTGDYYQSLDKRTAQKAPFNIPTANTADRRYIHSSVLIGGYPGGQSFAEANSNVYYSDTMAKDQASNTARSRLMKNLHDEAMLAVNFFEREQAARMFTSRAMQIFRFAKALKSGNIFLAERELNIRRRAQAIRELRSKGLLKDKQGRKLPNLPPSNGAKWKGSKALSNAWLEYHFGLEPLVKDLQATFDVMTDLPPMGSVRGSSKVKGSVRSTQNLSSTIRLYTEYLYSYQYWTGCNIQIRDRDAYLANRLGLVNPIAWVYELTPWSFLLDWFVNIGDYINGMTDLYGVQVSNPWTSYAQKQTGYQRRYTISGPQVGYMTSREDNWFQRDLALLTVKLSVKPLKRLSLTRAATAISLLVQQLPRR